VVRLYKIVLQVNPNIFHFSWQYLIVSLVFVVFGGLFAVAWNDDNPIKCLYVGVSFPIIISAWGQSPLALPK